MQNQFIVSIMQLRQELMYLNPSASRQGNAPHAMLLVDSDPFNSLFKIQQLLPCHGKKRGVLPSHVEPDLQLGSGHACHSWLILLKALLPSWESTGKATHQWEVPL